LHDKLPDVIWTRYFVECQGYEIDEYVIFQDNMSALSLEKNGRISSSKRTKHIKAKFFLIKDYYEAGEIDVRYCPTDVMWADVLTKPLQGQKFRDMRAFLQNCSRSYDDDIELQTDELARKSMKPQVKTVASSRECVGERAKSTREKKGGNKSVSWGGETRVVSHEKTPLEGILKRSHVAKPRGQKICKEQG
jgi:hypothetical protein